MLGWARWNLADLLERVRASLAGRYTIERELGRGEDPLLYATQAFVIGQHLGRHHGRRALREAGGE